MHKFISVLIIAAACVSGSAAAADNRSRDNPSPQPAYDAARAQSYEAADPGYAIFDIVIIRPLGLAATAIGSAFFIASSPFTAMASIPKPHNAFATSYNVLVRLPARYTFVRPVGDKTLAGYGTQYGKTSAAMQNTRY